MNDTLLNTREAARFLKVSEASIRRWTDGGILPTSRVGRRRARRFREEDLRRFLQGGKDAPAAAAVEPQPAGISLQGMTVSLGSHLAAFYVSDEGRFRLSLPLLRDGLRAQQTSILVATPDVTHAYLHALKKEGLDVDAAIGIRLLMLAHLDRSPPERRIAYLEGLFMEASRTRPGPIRLVGEVLASVESVGSVPVHLTFEHMLTALAKRWPVVMLCQYDVRAFDSVTMLEALKIHFDTFQEKLGYFLS